MKRILQVLSNRIISILLLVLYGFPAVIGPYWHSHGADPDGTVCTQDGTVGCDHEEKVHTHSGCCSHSQTTCSDSSARCDGEVAESKTSERHGPSDHDHSDHCSDCSICVHYAQASENAQAVSVQLLLATLSLECFFDEGVLSCDPHPANSRAPPSHLA